MNTSQQKIIDKISKLLALGTSPHREEAQAALAKAREIAIEYDITIEDITPANSSIARVTSVRIEIASAPKIYTYIYTLLETCFNTHIVLGPGCLVLYGESVDLAVAKHIIEWLPKEIKRLYLQQPFGTDLQS